jgi:hypothetical protein
VQCARARRGGSFHGFDFRQIRRNRFVPSGPKRRSPSALRCVVLYYTSDDRSPGPPSNGNCVHTQSVHNSRMKLFQSTIVSNVVDSTAKFNLKHFGFLTVLLTVVYSSMINNIWVPRKSSFTKIT